MRDTRVRRQLGHRFAMGRQFWPTQGAQAFQQLLRLCITRGRRHIEPDQLLRGNAPTRQLQGQPGQVGLEDFSAAIGRQLRMLVL